MPDIASKIIGDEQIRQEKMQQKIEYATRKVVKEMLYKLEQERKLYENGVYLLKKPTGENK